MNTRQTSFQMDEDTEALIAFLKDRGFGTTTNILREAVKRMAEQEGKKMRTYFDDRDPDKVIEAIEQHSGRVYVYMNTAGIDQYMESFVNWDAFLLWKEEYPGLR